MNNSFAQANERINTYWNSPLCVDEYDQNHARGIGAALDDQVWKEEFAKYLPIAPASVLDLGCGTGFASVLLAELGYTVTGLDQSENMLAQAQKKAADRKVAVSFVQGNVMAPYLPHDSFDIIIARWVFWTLPDPAAAVRQAYSLLARGGMLAVFDGIWFKNPECTGTDDSQQIPSEPDSERDRLWANLYTKEFLAALPLLGGNPPETLAAFFKEAGFVHIEHCFMPYANQMYRQHRGANWSEDQLYVVRGFKPKG
ncbi:MAG: class I SAM-dependent methyltransferase [Brachymonas sp.]